VQSEHADLADLATREAVIGYLYDILDAVDSTRLKALP
jgi:hypothetical protein